MCTVCRLVRLPKISCNIYEEVMVLLSQPTYYFNYNNFCTTFDMEVTCKRIKMGLRNALITPQYIKNDF